MDMKFENAYQKVCELVDDFEKHYNHYKSHLDEASTRKRFIDRFFTALGWAVDPDNKISPHLQEVTIEDPQKQKLNEGTKIYIERKRRKGIEPIHVVQRGETMHSISQLHGIRIYWLYKRNKMKEGAEPSPGDILILKRGGNRFISKQDVPGNKP